MSTTAGQDPESSPSVAAPSTGFEIIERLITEILTTGCPNRAEQWLTKARETLTGFLESGQPKRRQDEARRILRAYENAVLLVRHATTQVQSR